MKQLNGTPALSCNDFDEKVNRESFEVPSQSGPCLTWNIWNFVSDLECWEEVHRLRHLSLEEGHECESMCCCAFLLNFESVLIERKSSGRLLKVCDCVRQNQLGMTEREKYKERKTSLCRSVLVWGKKCSQRGRRLVLLLALSSSCWPEVPSAGVGLRRSRPELTATESDELSQGVVAGRARSYARISLSSALGIRSCTTTLTRWVPRQVFSFATPVANVWKWSLFLSLG